MAEMTSFIPLGLQLAGTLFQDEGTQIQAQAQTQGFSRQGDAALAQGEVSVVAARNRKAALDYQADQLVVNAGQQQAAAQRTAADRRRDAELVQSRALAVAAAGGGGVSDPTIVNIMGKVAGEGAYRAGLALYDGEERARELRMKAAAARFEGELALQGGAAARRAAVIAKAGFDAQARDVLESAENQRMTNLLKAAPGIFNSVSSLFSKYGGGGPGSVANGDSNLIGDFGDGFGVSNIG